MIEKRHPFMFYLSLAPALAVQRFDRVRRLRELDISLTKHGRSLIE